MTPRTYYDKLGNLREYGTGKLLKANARKVLPQREQASRFPTKPKFPNAKTYKGPNGEIRPINRPKPRPKPKPKPAGPRPRPAVANVGAPQAGPMEPEKTLEQRVEELLGGYDNEMTRVANYAAGATNQDTRLGAFYDQQVGKIATTGGVDGAPVDPVMQKYLAAAQQAGMAQTNEMNYATRLRAEEDLRGMRSEKSTARAELMKELEQQDWERQMAEQEFGLKMRDQSFDERLAQQELGFNMGQQKFDNNMAMTELGMAQQQQAWDMAQPQGGAGGGSAAGRPTGMTPTQTRNQATKVRTIRSNIGSKELKNPPQVVKALIKAGVHPNNALAMVMNWMPQMSSVLKTQGSYRVFQELQSYGVSTAVIRRTIVRLFGKRGWTDLQQSLNGQMPSSGPRYQTTIGRP